MVNPPISASSSAPASPPTGDGAVVLLSGGLDSTTVLAIARSEDLDIHAVSFRYGQRHSIEIAAAQRIARKMGVRDHRIIDIDLAQFGGSALTADIAVPKDRDLGAGSPASHEIPITYVPARNTIFLSYALALAEVTGSTSIFIGVNALDYSGYPDCRPEYIKAFETMANLATRAGVEGKTRLSIRTPLISLTKAAIITLGTSLGVDYSDTTSCYDPAPDGEACGRCDACQLRLKGFREAGLADPIAYARAARRVAGSGAR
ncbi:MAG TPA: 7-cyano-7-deazaguanine synthase QueC [Gemmatimonadaceae bacterium]|jgi:7-cyano-7-deazaguanine synthase|nr:7-cyano-7-deazaguanine synthase QueC [Gemmatimonadaceae bacterium]